MRRTRSGWKAYTRQGRAGGGYGSAFTDQPASCQHTPDDRGALLIVDIPMGLYEFNGSQASVYL